MAAERFGPYLVQELIGRGGMGEVHRAHDTVRQRTVALKRLRPEFAADERFRARFVRECRQAAQLVQPHVVPIHDFGEIDGRLYLDMQLIQGDNLEQILRRHGPLAPDRAVTVVTQVAAALDAAHAAGLMHRDVKPSNVLLSAGGPELHCYLADFGVAAAIRGGGSLTATGTTVGTMDYIAPERLRGRQIDHRVDVYSLACLLHEALTGHPPFRADELAAMINAHLNLEPPRPSEFVPTVPAGLDPVVARGMAKDPDARYPTAGELAAAAGEALQARSPDGAATPVTVSAHLGRTDGVVTAAGSTQAVSPPPHPLRRRRWAPRLLAVCLLLLAAGAIAGGRDLLDSVKATPVVAEPADQPGRHPFTPPPGAQGPPPPSTPPAPVSGDTAGLYGGSGAEGCDPAGMATYLETHPDRGQAWAAAQAIRPDGIRSYLSTLTPVVLRTDTAVTNHGFRYGRATPFQSVLQAGTAVLVDDRGVPRVRCSCGNPLGTPAARYGAGAPVSYVGKPWPGLAGRPVTVVRPAPQVVQRFVVVVQQNTAVVVERPRATHGEEDQPASPEAVGEALAFPADRAFSSDGPDRGQGAAVTAPEATGPRAGGRPIVEGRTGGSS